MRPDATPARLRRQVDAGGAPDRRYGPARRDTLRLLGRVRADELEHAHPGVGRLLLELGVLAVEEAVRRAGVHHDLVVNAGLAERLVEPLDGVERDALVRAAEEAEDGALELGRRLGGGGSALAPLGDAAVEPDDAGEAVVLRGLQEGVAAAEAEA